MTPSPIRIEFGAARWDAWKVSGAIVLACAVAFAIMLVKVGAMLAADRSQFVAQQRSFKAATAPASGASADPVTARVLKEANGVLDALSVRWDDLFVMIEGAGSKDLGLLSLTPDPRNGSLRISGDARTFDDVVSYVGRLSHQPLLQDVNLLSYQTAQRGNAQVVEFVIAAKWK